jgi:hypothetical protein
MLRPTAVLVALASLSTSALAQDWSNAGGNNARNGLTSAIAPTDVNSDNFAWNSGDFSIISWQPVTLGDAVFAVRETGFPTNGGTAGDTITAWNVRTGEELWDRSLPFSGNTTTNWIAWIGGARDGKLYASRSGNGATVSAPLTALNAATGATIWTSAANTAAGSYDGMVFAPDGDPIVADFRNVTRINSTDGATVWRVSRLGSVSGNCGAAVTADAVFIVDAVPGGHSIKKLSMTTGALLYQSPVMPGFTAQNSPFLSPDGTTVYFSRTQNNPAADFLYSFNDTGTALVQRWSRAVRWTTSHEFGIAADGSVYTFLADNSFVRLDPATGDVLNSAGILEPIGGTGVNLSAKTAVDGAGNVYVSNGWASNPPTEGRLWAFSADLATTHFTLTLDRQNNGGPAIAADGTLVMADRQGVRAWLAPAPCPADFNADSFVDFFDFDDFALCFEGGTCPAGKTPDFNADGFVDFFDFDDFVAAFEAGC